jgi:STE24 endopeptidase
MARRYGWAAGLATGFTLAYAAVRAWDMQRDRETPWAPRERDPKRYGDARRLVHVVELARTAAASATWAFVLADPLERALGGFPRPLRLPLAALTLLAVDAAREWPIDYVEGFVTERIYGNSERTVAAWAGDRKKALAVGAAVTVPLAFAIDAIVHRAPRRWPWFAIAAMPGLSAFALVIAPTFVMPLFNKYLPLEGPLEAKIRALASRYGVGGATILRFDMSRQTKKANAFVTGVFGTERIAVADTLLDAFAEDETLFVVAHELGHYVRRDPWVAVGFSTAIFAFTLLVSTSFARASAGRDEGIGFLFRLAFFLTLMQTAAMPLANAFSRRLERRADVFALGATDDADAGIRAFRRLRDQNLAEDEGPKWAEVLFASHPSLKSRISALETSAAT